MKNVCKSEWKQWKENLQFYVAPKSVFRLFVFENMREISSGTKRWHHHQVHLKRQTRFSDFFFNQLYAPVKVYLDLKLHGIHFQSRYVWHVDDSQFCSTRKSYFTRLSSHSRNVHDAAKKFEWKNRFLVVNFPLRLYGTWRYHRR